ncbi:MAG: hypothetical protein ACJ8BF_14770 [Gemmatimonadales bacterium]
MTYRTGWLLAAAVAGLSCGAPTDGCGCPPAVAAARLFGRVETTSGTPVDKAMIFAYVANESGCVRHTDADGVGETAPDGSYGFDLVYPDSGSICVLVAFRTPTGSSLTSSPDQSVTLAFRFSGRPDSARADAIFTE